MSQFRSNFLPSSTSSYREGRIASFRETDYSFLSSSQNYKRALYQDLLNRRSLDISLNRKIDNRRNGFVYEDIYAKTPLFNDFNDSNALYSSPYKPIKPEYLALPDNYSKYSTLPKNWNLSSSNSYKTHLNSTVRDIPHDYNRRLREYQGYKPRQRPRTNRSSGYVNDIDIYER